jgi:hypothetical protein
VAIGEPAARGDEDPGLHRGRRGTRALGHRQAGDLVAIEPAAGRGDALGEQARLGCERGERGPDRAPQARGRLALTARERPRGFDCEQRIALRRADDLRDVVVAECADRPRQVGDGVVGERPEIEGPAQRATRAERLLDRVDLRARRQRAACEEDEDRQPGGVAAGVGEQLQARRVRQVHVLERERQPPPTRAGRRSPRAGGRARGPARPAGARDPGRHAVRGRARSARGWPATPRPRATARARGRARR